NGTANNLLNISSNESHLSQDPQNQPCPIGVLLPAQLRQVPPGRHPEPRRQKLYHQPHDGGPHQQPKQGVTCNRTSLKIPFEVPRVQKRHAHQQPWPCEQPQLPPRKRRHRRGPCCAGRLQVKYLHLVLGCIHGVFLFFFFFFVCMFPV
ncbi:hypothetical protein VIGAN_09166500, partial [Vigna angularis var. angularis]